MSSEWKETTLGEICKSQGGAIQTGPFGSQLHTSDYKEFGIPVVMPTNINDGGIFEDGIARIDSADVERLSQHKLRLGDIIFSRRGDVTKNALIRSREIGWLCGTGCLKVRLGNESLATAKFISNCLRHPDTKDWLVRHAVGATMPNLNTGILSNVPVKLPPLQTQQEIALILDSLDDRITLLRETNATLEAIAQALFKSWFVDFDPVHAKMQGTQPEGMDEQTAALFPDSFEESELGLVPAGWEVEFLTDVFDFKEGPGIRNWQYTNSDEGTKFINIRCIQDGDLTLGTANRITDEEANGKYLHFHLEEWDVVVSTSGTLGRSAIVRKEHLPLMLNTSVIRFRPIAEKVGFCFLYEYLNFPEFLYKLESMASGSVQKNFGPMHLKQIKLVCAPISIISDFEAICLPLFEKVIQNRARIDNLVSLRDTLLPRLISGQLRVGEVDATI